MANYWRVMWFEDLGLGLGFGINRVGLFAWHALLVVTLEIDLKSAIRCWKGFGFRGLNIKFGFFWV